MRQSQTNKLRFFLLIVLSLSLAQTNTITKTKQLNLQQNERYIQDLSEFFKEPATAVLWPETIDESQKIEAYKLINDFKDLPPIIPLANFMVGDNVKYIIGISQNTNAQLQKIFLDADLNCLNQDTVSTQQLDVLKDAPLFTFASFYNQNAGFVSYEQKDGKFKSYQFIYNAQKGFSFQILNNISLKSHVSLLGPNNFIYIIQVTLNEYKLLKIDENMQVLFQKTTPTIDCLYEMPIIDTAKYLLNYCFNDASIKYATINYRTDTLVVNSILIQTSNGYYGYAYQRIGSHLLIALTEPNETRILKLISNDNVNDGTFDLLQVTTIPYQLQRITFVSQNLISAIYNNDSLQIYDISKEQAVYVVQVQANMIIQRTINIQNQLLLYLFQYDKDNKIQYQMTKAVQVNLPQLILYGQDQTIEMSITAGVLQNIYKVSIQISTPPQPIVQFTQNQVSLQDMLTTVSSQFYLIPIENYVISSYPVLYVTVAQESQKTLLNASVVKQINIDSNQIKGLDESCKFFQVNNYFSSIIQCNVQQQYYIYAAISSIEDGKANVSLLQGEFNLSSQIDIIDDMGSFIQLSDKTLTQKNIILPFIRGNELGFNIVQVQCSEANFNFSSDPSFSVLFVVCGSKLIKYTYKSYQANSIASIITSDTLEFNPSTFSQLICTEGYLIMSSSSQIAAYDYINNGFVGRVITVPILVKDQQQNFILFKNSFFVCVLAQPITQIAQYSYNNFATSDPIFLRNLQIDDDTPISQNGSVIPVRGNINYLYVLSVKNNIYYIYRVDSKQFQNQLYTTVIVRNTVSMINSELICSLYPNVSCTQILKQTSIQYQLNIDQNGFNQILSYVTNFTIAQEQNKQSYSLVINRDASAGYGTINQNADTIQNIKTQLQDTNYIAGQVFPFNDQQVFNACLTGWQEQDNNAQIINRIASNNPMVSDQVYTILYNQIVTVQTNQIKSFFTIQGSFSDCNVLDDKASLTNQNQQTYKFDLYIICLKFINQYSIEYSQDQTGQLTNPMVTLKKTATFKSPPNLLSYKKIISSNNQLSLFQTDGLSQSILSFNDQDGTAQISDQLNNYYTKRSINVIQKYNLSLIIMNGGLISAQSVKAGTSTVQYIQDLLTSFNFVVDRDDYITTVEQYSDTQFRLAFLNSYIYDIEFAIDNNNIHNNALQLVLLSARKYYYQNAFPHYIYGYQGSTYTLLFGYNFGTQIVAALYRNDHIQQNQLLIESTNIKQFATAYLIPTSVIQLENNTFQIQLSNSKQYTLIISDTVGLQVSNQKKSYNANSQTTIYPKGQSNPQNFISFVLSSSSSNPSNSQNILFSLVNMLAVLIILLF